MVSRICQLLPSFGADISSEPSEKRNLTCSNMYITLHIELILLIITHNFSGLFKDLFNSFFFWLNRPKNRKIKKVIKVKPTFWPFFKRVWLERSRFRSLPAQAPLSGGLCHENHYFLK